MRGDAVEHGAVDVVDHAGARPTFLVIGAGKAGTTTLHHMLDTLSEVHMSTPKETKYFSIPEDPRFPLPYYYEIFAPGAHLRHRAESCPTYTMFPAIRGVPERIHAMNPDIRLIYMVREPVARMVSAYAQGRRSGKEVRPIEEALTQDLTYTAPSRYWLQLNEYLRLFDLEQIHVEDIRDLRRDPMGVLNRIARFLEVPCDGHPVTARNERNWRAARRPYTVVLKALRRRGLAHKSWQSRMLRSPIGSRPLDPDELRIGPDLEAELRRVFRQDVSCLEDLLEREFPHWRIGA